MRRADTQYIFVDLNRLGGQRSPASGCGKNPWTPGLSPWCLFRVPALRLTGAWLVPYCRQYWSRHPHVFLLSGVSVWESLWQILLEGEGQGKELRAFALRWILTNCLPKGEVPMRTQGSGVSLPLLTWDWVSFNFSEAKTNGNFII